MDFKAYDDGSAVGIFIEGCVVFCWDCVCYVYRHTAACGTSDVVSGWIDCMTGITNFKPVRRERTGVDFGTAVCFG